MNPYISNVKYRGKRLDNNSWVYGYYLRLTYEVGPHASRSITTKVDHFIVPFNSDKAELIHVNPETIGISIGCIDFKKSDPKVDIYTGDICTQLFDDQPTTGIITFESSRGAIIGGRPVWPWTIEVIGNQWDNPDMYAKLPPVRKPDF